VAQAIGEPKEEFDKDMEIKPTGTGPQADTALEAAKARDAQRAARGVDRRVDQDAGPRQDKVEVSDEARNLAEAGQGRAVTQSSLSPDRLREIGERLASGFYDRPEVIEEVARRVITGPDNA
jgi:hypothetical protein